ncbi:hypothetical protein HNV12_02460 [Methanococcoides sp. SA1]|nr:hypothetical protein [Methanococcoides sp. SA1]
MKKGVLFLAFVLGLTLISAVTESDQDVMTQQPVSYDSTAPIDGGDVAVEKVITSNNQNISEVGDYVGDTTQEQQRLQVRDQISSQLQQQGLTLEETRSLETRLRDIKAESTPKEFKTRLMAGEEATLYTGGKIRRVNGDLEIMAPNGEMARTRLNLTDDAVEGLKAKLSNGRNAQIKIMPEVASERALERLRLKNCNELHNCTIELKEVGEGNQTRAAYEVRARKTFRLLGLFKNQEEVLSQIDAETGEEIRTKRPWWSFLATEENETESEE